MSRKRSTLWCVMLLIALKVVGGSQVGSGHQDTPAASLRKIGPAPAFSLTTQDGTRLSLKQLRGKVVVVTFMYTSCADTCPLLTAKMAGLQARLGMNFGSRVFFVAITVDPEQDTPAILKRYAEPHGVDLAGWAFLTGTPSEIREVARQYGVVYKKRPRKIAAYRQLQHDTMAELYHVASSLLGSNERTFKAALRRLTQFNYNLERLQFIAQDEAEVIGRVQQDYKRFIQVVSHMVEFIQAGKVAEGLEFLRTQASPPAARLERLANELANRAEADMVESLDASDKAYVTSQWVVIGFAAGSIGLALVLGYAISWSLVGPVKQMETRLQQIASGDFSQWVAVPNRDELGALGTNLNQMNDELKQLYEQRERHISFIRQTFGRYLSNEVVANLLDSPAGLELGGEKRTVTILMSDLRGFTAVAERLDAQEVMSFLNRYLEAMVNVILSYQGTIIEILGDGLLVLFGAPMSRGDDPERAVACAVSMQLQMEGVNALLRKENLPDIEMGIGIHTGDVVVGNIGSEQRTKYGVVGSAVNLTGRVESYTTGSQILISPSTYAATAQLLMIRQELTVEPKGVPEPITIYDVGGIGGAYDLFLTEQEENLTPLAREIAVSYTVLVLCQTLILGLALYREPRFT